MLPVDFEPSNNDVLCGRGNVYSNHYGNQFFGKVIRDNITVYKEATTRPDKIKVVDGILDKIRDNGARFTKVDTQTERWYELNDVQAHQKIGHAIRDTIRLLRKGGNNNNNSIITTSNNYTTPKEEKTSIAIRTRRTSKSLVAKKKMFQQKKRQSRITIQREQLQKLVRSLDDEYVLEQQENDDHYCRTSLLPLVSSTFTLLEGYITTNNNKESFLLEDEFPEHQFSFKASHFFEKNNNDDETIDNDSNILSQ
ncbi:hypothetical protein FRACYDRAFT_196709 [Fragilariopsis cylindrus CCMP1102]|uniref:DUF6824 domain-containing protein n=1 Tax=Fragilariopsis cylindrus CCMP1102 TaxID=635003 RepID=A0A1E7EQR8_9STRA|nr:hypothetical protein FRACYDRAFT_196709 [Fragilariopsis cylindrus CCMP1102]|eukprot:OEU08272.1 hypothetical protein FRACYDRAFT_196709 [Fragilariopsis cylindrus CCMP1102]